MVKKEWCQILDGNQKIPHARRSCDQGFFSDSFGDRFFWLFFPTLFSDTFPDTFGDRFGDQSQITTSSGLLFLAGWPASQSAGRRVSKALPFSFYSHPGPSVNHQFSSGGRQLLEKQKRIDCISRDGYRNAGAIRNKNYAQFGMVTKKNVNCWEKRHQMTQILGC